MTLLVVVLGGWLVVALALCLLVGAVVRRRDRAPDVLPAAPVRSLPPGGSWPPVPAPGPPTALAPGVPAQARTSPVRAVAAVQAAGSPS